jgi:D-alanyl-lipoteichoic acid acyltransferase DltB (MBOAT superfamily)
MSPYSGLLFFGILILVLLPGVILGLLGKSLRIYGLIATAVLLLTAFDT